jgi:transcriptional regulator with XRE-family HTH domain
MARNNLIGDRIRDERMRAGMTRESVAVECGIDARSLLEYERGRTFPRIDKLQRIAKCLRTTVAYLIGEDAGAATRQERAALAAVRKLVATLKSLPEIN